MKNIPFFSVNLRSANIHFYSPFIKSEKTMLLTGLTKPQVIYTADAVNIKAICFVRGKQPEEDVIELANELGIPLFYTKLPMFESCGRLYKEGLKGCSEYE